MTSDEIKINLKYGFCKVIYGMRFMYTVPYTIYKFRALKVIKLLAKYGFEKVFE